MSGVHIKQDKKNSNNEVSVSTSFEPKAQAPPTGLGGGSQSEDSWLNCESCKATLRGSENNYMKQEMGLIGRL